MRENEYLYNEIVKDIINSDEFSKLDDCIHHGITRMQHSSRVSFYSYKIAKLLNLDYCSVARAGLLHDFFDNKNINSKEKFKSIFLHPAIAVSNSETNFSLNEKEKNIILSHMFPLVPIYFPKFLESWIVSTVDKVVAVYEFYVSFSSRYKYANNFVLLILLLGR